MMNNANFNIDYLRKYIHGELSSKEMYDIERASQEDEMLMDIIMGLELEKTQKLAPAKTDLLQAINERLSEKQKTVPLFNKRFLSIAASIIFLFGIGAALYFYQFEENKKIELSTINQPVPKTSNITKVDSIPNTVESSSVSKEQDNLITESKVPNKETAIPLNPIVDNKIAMVEEQHSILNSNIKSNDTIENPFKEILIAHNNSGIKKSAVDLQPKQVILPSQTAHVNSQVVGQAQSSTQLHARVNNMNLDPQTQAILREVIDRNEREQANSRKANNNNQILTDSTAGTALASAKKSRQSVTGSVLNKSDESIVLAPSSISTLSQPLIPKSEYLKNIHSELAKLTAKNYTIKLVFSLDTQGKPKNIKILETTDTVLNQEVKRIVEKGSKWFVGTDKDSILLEINK